VDAPTEAVVEPPMLAVPLAVPLPETETDVVTLAVEVLAVLDALAEPAIAWLVLNIKDNNRAGNTNCFETFIDRPFRIKMALCHFRDHARSPPHA
jgi:hypothetical protein